jgi:hypothetical protein
MQGLNSISQARVELLRIPQYFYVGIIEVTHKVQALS